MPNDKNKQTEFSLYILQTFQGYVFETLLYHS